MNIPNILTALRFLLVPAFAYYLCTRSYVVAVILFLSGGLTDILDGYIARKYNLVTSWGKIADPLADKLMQVTAMVILSLAIKIIPVQLLIIIIVKEISLGIGALILYKQNNYVSSANWYGKMATVVFYLAIVMMIFDEPFGKHWPFVDMPFNRFFFLLAVLAAMFSFIMYVRAYIVIVQKKERKV